MAQDYNLGRVQGKGLWIADATFTTSGTITLASGFTIQPLVEDYVIDKETNNVYAIATISGTNPFNFTTNGTPIFTLGGGSLFKKRFSFGKYERNEVVDETLVNNFTEFFNDVLNINNIAIINSAVNYKINSSDIYFKVYESPYIQPNKIISWYNESGGDSIFFALSNKTFTMQGTEAVWGGYVEYSIFPVSSTLKIKYDENSINLVSLQGEENTYQFNNEEFKNNLIKEPNNVFLTINNYEYKGFFKEDNVYKHIDNEYKVDEETKEEKLIKTYTCIINLDTNTISYTEEEVN